VSAPTFKGRPRPDLTEVKDDPGTYTDGRGGIYISDEATERQEERVRAKSEPRRAANAAPTTERRREVVVTPAGTIKPKAVRWLYEQRVPLGKLTVVAGRPGLGKSMWTTSLAAAVSNGELPGDLAHTASHVLLASAEDDPEDTIVPRLIAAGADLNFIGLLDLTTTDDNGAIVPGTIALPNDVPRIAEHVKARGARLIVVDPITGFLDAAHSAYSNQEVRRALGPLAQLARDEHCAVIAVMHLNKSTSTDPLARIADSGAFTALARSVLLFGADPDDPEGDHGNRRVLTIAKGNLKAAGTQALTLEVVGCTIETAEGAKIATARIDVTGTSDASAEDVLGGADERSAAEDAKRFLRAELADGPVPAKAVQEAAKLAGVSETTLARVKRRMNVRSVRPGGTGAWLWQLPDQPNTPCHLDHLDHLAPHLEHQEGQEGLDGQDSPRDKATTKAIVWDFTANGSSA
jgi:hypothetical protein